MLTDVKKKNHLLQHTYLTSAVLILKATVPTNEIMRRRNRRGLLVLIEVAVSVDLDAIRIPGVGTVRGR